MFHEVCLSHLPIDRLTDWLVGGWVGWLVGWLIG